MGEIGCTDTDSLGNSAFYGENGEYLGHSELSADGLVEYYYDNNGNFVGHGERGLFNDDFAFYDVNGNNQGYLSRKPDGASCFYGKNGGLGYQPYHGKGYASAYGEHPIFSNISGQENSNSHININDFETQSSFDDCYKCGIKTFHAITGIKFDSEGHSSTNATSFNYSNITERSFNKYTSYLKSIGISPSNVTDDYLVTYSYKFKTDKKSCVLELNFNVEAETLWVLCIEIDRDDVPIKQSHTKQNGTENMNHVLGSIYYRGNTFPIEYSSLKPESFFKEYDTCNFQRSHNFAWARVVEGQKNGANDLKPISNGKYVFSANSNILESYCIPKIVRSYEGHGKSLDEAFNNAIQQFDSSCDVFYKQIIQTPVSGFLGIGRKEAIVRVVNIQDSQDSLVGIYNCGIKTFHDVTGNNNVSTYHWDAAGKYISDTGWSKIGFPSKYQGVSYNQFAEYIHFILETYNPKTVLAKEDNFGFGYYYYAYETFIPSINRRGLLYLSYNSKSNELDVCEAGGVIFSEQNSI